MKIKLGFFFVLDNFYSKAQPALLNAGEMGKFLTCFWQSSSLRLPFEPHNIHYSSLSLEKWKYLTLTSFSFFRVTFLVVCFVILFAVDYPPPPRDQHRQAPVVQPGELRLNHWLLRRRPNKSSLNWQTTLSSKSWDRSWLWLSRQWIVSKTLVAILRKWIPTSQGRKSSGWYLFSVEVHSEVGT